ncbi:MAG: pyridoxal phosphate-dependent aminotransferase [Thermoplasmatota archaeon]
MKGLLRPDWEGYELQRPGTGYDLASNTNLFGANPAGSGPPPSLGGYPDEGDLGVVAARHYGVKAEEVVIAAGSDQILDMVFRAALRPGGRVAFLDPTFSMVPILAAQNHGVATAVPEEAPDSLSRLAGADVMYLCRPNNPTGHKAAASWVRKLVADAQGLVVLDEAYVEYSGDSLTALAGQAENLVVLRTLSKAHGLAGARVGFGLMPAALAARVRLMGGPYKLPSHSIHVARRALEDDAFWRATVAATLKERPLWVSGLEALHCAVRSGETNFVLFQPPAPAHRVAALLAKRGYLVRSFEGTLSPWLRATIGPAALRAAFLAELGASLEEAR